MDELMLYQNETNFSYKFLLETPESASNNEALLANNGAKNKETDHHILLWTPLHGRYYTSVLITALQYSFGLLKLKIVINLHFLNSTLQGLTDDKKKSQDLN